MQTQEFHILNHLTDEDFKYLRRFVISNILNTDMKKHFQLLRDFEMNLKRHKEDNVPLIRPDHEENDKKMLTGVIVHSADLSSPTREFEISKSWSLMIS